MDPGPPNSGPLPCLSYARLVLTILQRFHLALAVTGLGLAVAAPSLASDRSSTWTLNMDPGVSAPQVAVLPALPGSPSTYAITPERRALLNTIRYSEGTWINGDPTGYRVLFGGSLTSSLDRHPDRVMYSSRYASAAAGAYQFMPFTWSMASKALGLADFQPEAQDQAALFLVHRRGALALADRGVLTPELTARLSPEWASFPTLAGSSYYGQPVQRYADLKRFYDENLAQLRGDDRSGWQNVAIRQVAPCDERTLSCQLDGVNPSLPAKR